MELDQFYTKLNIAEMCFKSFLELDFKVDHFIEPSAGEGVFLDVIKSNIKGYDIDPKREDITRLDFLNDTIEVKENSAIIGNPPFGKRSSTAIDFFNKASKYVDIIAFILPLQFRKYLTQNKLNNNFNLNKELILPKNAFIYNNKNYSLRSVFQVWSKNGNDLRIRKKPPTEHKDFEMFLYNNTIETLKYFNKDKYKWDFAIHRQGFYNYNKIITEVEELNKKKQYMFIKSKYKSALNKLYNMDYNNLSLKNTIIPGFGKADLVEEYEYKYGKCIFKDLFI